MEKEIRWIDTLSYEDKCKALKVDEDIFMPPRKNMRWYESLILPVFVDYFSNPDSKPVIEKNGEIHYSEEFRNYISIVDGITVSNTLLMMPTEKKFFDIKNTILQNRYWEVVGIATFLNDPKCVNINTSKSIKKEYRKDFEGLDAEDIAVHLMYPFWSRMGGSFEKEFCESGKLLIYMKALKKRHEEELQKGVIICTEQ